MGSPPLRARSSGMVIRRLRRSVLTAVLPRKPNPKNRVIVAPYCALHNQYVAPPRQCKSLGQQDFSGCREAVGLQGQAVWRRIALADNRWNQLRMSGPTGPEGG